jgi:sterol desaturase/sphingolipid hydroxylase (fatty acid hydroxylase superfamily)
MIIVILMVAAFVIALEFLFPAWELKKVDGWYRRVFLINSVQIIVAITAGLTWDRWLSEYSLFNLSPAYPVWIAAFVAYFANTFVTYWWHRWRHHNHTLWLLFHQLHHSPSRIETLTSFYKHPFEMIINSIIGATVAYAILGISVEAGGLYIFFAACGEIFYHSNLRTPHLLGYFFQRPEMHRIHHKRGHHYNNFSDFPVWDILFGTFKNPVYPRSEQGFSNNREKYFFSMLVNKDVNPNKNKID